MPGPHSAHLGDSEGWAVGWRPEGSGAGWVDGGGLGGQASKLEAIEGEAGSEEW